MLLAGIMELFLPIKSQLKVYGKKRLFIKKSAINSLDDKTE